MKIFKLAQSNDEYMIEKGMLYDNDAEDVFTMKELIRYNVPLFRSATDANEFLAKIELKTNRTFGRVPNKDYMKELRYKDTRKEKEIANMQMLDERNQRNLKGEF